MKINNSLITFKKINIFLTFFLTMTYLLDIIKSADIGTLSTVKPFNDDSYIFSWAVAEHMNQIQFNLDVATTGWVGIGFSTNGMMANSDMILCYINKNSLPNCTDRFASGRNVPELDTLLSGTDNLESITGSSTNGRSKFSFIRTLTTNDKNDYQIVKGKEINVIFSYRKIGNPDTENGVFLQHTKYSGMKLILLTSTGQTVENKDYLNVPNVKKMTLKFDKYLIPSKTTSYICRNYNITQMANEITKLPIGTIYHAVAFEPIIDKTEFMHHLVMFSCDSQVEITGKEYECSAFSPLCQKINFEWLPGSGIYQLPKEVGMLWGVSENKLIILQNHYNNVKNQVGFSDSSYINIYFTNQLRKYDSATMIAGVQQDFINIPPQSKGYLISDTCSSNCTQKLTDSIYIFSVFLHGHLSLRKIRTEIKYKNGTVDNTTLREDNFKFHNQKYVNLINPIKLVSGDELTTYCEYDTRDRTGVVKGGEDSSDEMCLSFINYYPRENGFWLCMGALPEMYRCIPYGFFDRTQDALSIPITNQGVFVSRLGYFILGLVIILI